ncbi:Na+/Picotransporter [Caldalkalibacillus thermarum TA2.A1]|uniref:Na+/Picotransporter n=1 Tax=Caldalkalibacillus thermarum (strain TA2.A1) TaxID=986075 RepID=F5L7N1_CALTT|nr:Na/Pi symporter [Caldalkalibacillus thermarum]EGL82675.1 Na+/Picotransporter [Caldalkalibacillus thermarum TA2.A1]QZT33392.1 Na/Pi symporter [Caldalkalibacillus thermarum TA2.A1]
MVMKDLVIPLAAGLAIFLFGMQVMRIGFEHLFLEKAKKILGTLTRTPVAGLVSGTVATAILQSSSAVLLLVIGLTHARIMTFRQTIGVILGANIGTVVTTELLAISVHQLGVYFFILGAVLFLCPRTALRASGMVTGGFGLLFLGMETMQGIAPFLESLSWLENASQWGQKGILSGIGFGLLLTAVIQSSTATTVIAMNLTYEQLISLPLAIAIVLGSNIGTCVTALLGSMATNLAGRQVAVAHVLLNVLGVFLFIPLIPLLSVIVEQLTSNPMLQVAHAQTIFNVLCSLLALPFTKAFERMVLLVTRGSAQA